MEKSDYLDALERVNKDREKAKKPPLDFLPRGTPGTNANCPMAKAGGRPGGPFVSAFDGEVQGLVKMIDPWVLVENGDPTGGANASGNSQGSK